jgi:pimeloyl-ACP methyl ester carboxylesterase
MLAHDRTGSGPALVLIHGLGGARSNWKPVLAQLARHHEVIAVDLPGFGDSPALSPGDRPTAARMADAVALTLEQLGVGGFHVAGNSLGGWVALELAARRPAALSVTGVCTAGLWGKPLGPRPGPSVRGAGPFARPFLAAVAAVPALRGAVLSGVLRHPERLTAADALPMMRAYVGATAFDAADREMRASVFDLAGAALRVPITLLWGADDRLVRPTKRVPAGVRSIVVEDCGHLAMWDQPTVVARVILETAAAADPAPVREATG